MKKTKKAIISAVLTATLALSMAPVAFASSRSTAPVIDNDNKTVSVTNAEEFAWVSEHSKGAGTADMKATFSGWTILIKNDIDFNGTWTPITNFHGKMDGVAEGNGYVTISGLDVDTADNAALCGAITYGGDKPVFTDIRIANSDFYSNGAYAGAFVGNGFTAEFTNCHVANTAISATRFVGGIAGITYGKITNCSVAEATSITARGTSLLNFTLGDNAGGIVGLMGEISCAVVNCTVSGVEITGARQVGGIAGLANYGNKIDGCAVSDSTIKSVGKGFLVVPEKNSPAVGGIVGQFAIVGTNPIITITNNSVNGNMAITAVTGGTKYVGWAIGDANSRANPGEYDVYGNVNNSAMTGLYEIGCASSNPSTQA